MQAAAAVSSHKRLHSSPHLGGEQAASSTEYGIAGSRHSSSQPAQHAANSSKASLSSRMEEQGPPRRTQSASYRLPPTAPAPIAGSPSSPSSVARKLQWVDPTQHQQQQQQQQKAVGARPCHSRFASEQLSDSLEQGGGRAAPATASSPWSPTRSSTASQESEVSQQLHRATAVAAAQQQHQQQQQRLQQRNGSRRSSSGSSEASSVSEQLQHEGVDEEGATAPLQQQQDGRKVVPQAPPLPSQTSAHTGHVATSTHVSPPPAPQTNRMSSLPRDGLLSPSSSVGLLSPARSGGAHSGKEHSRQPAAGSSYSSTGWHSPGRRTAAAAAAASGTVPQSSSSVNSQQGTSGASYGSGASQEADEVSSNSAYFNHTRSLEPGRPHSSVPAVHSSRADVCVEPNGGSSHHSSSSSYAGLSGDLASRMAAGRARRASRSSKQVGHGSCFADATTGVNCLV